MKLFNLKKYLVAYLNYSISAYKEYRRNRRYKRYKYLFDSIKKMKCRRIMEIGTWNGVHAKQMIEAAKRYHGDKVEYYGFDLFELLNSETACSEFGKKIPPSENAVMDKLIQTGAKIQLFKGDTRVTLPKAIGALPKMDLIFIDGGHSLDTIKSDWENACKLMHEKTVVLFDDYWNRDDAGCKQIVENIDRNQYAVKVLSIQDSFEKEWGVLRINIVRVTRK